MQPCTYSLTPQVSSIEELIKKAKAFVASAKPPPSRLTETTVANSSAVVS
jgi:hypothetical protein